LGFNEIIELFSHCKTRGPGPWSCIPRRRWWSTGRRGPVTREGRALIGEAHAGSSGDGFSPWGILEEEGPRGVLTTVMRGGGATWLSLAVVGGVRRCKVWGAEERRWTRE
jgi:hypothetical protein